MHPRTFPCASAIENKWVSGATRRSNFVMGRSSVQVRSSALCFQFRMANNGHVWGVPPEPQSQKDGGLLVSDDGSGFDLALQFQLQSQSAIRQHLAFPPGPLGIFD